MNEQKAALLAKGWTEAELAENQWRPRPWGKHDDYKFDTEMEHRDFLRCPLCKAVGTYKPRRNDEYEHPRYYVCKWCGYGRNFDGEWQYWPNGEHWGIRCAASTPTPKEIMVEHNLDPWCG